ncbi:transcriptional regulator, partial [Bacillus safensis]
MSISWEMILPLIVLQAVLAVFALITCVREKETNGPKWVWAA